jgi:NAD(P)H-dependent FMN reductase
MEIVGISGSLRKESFNTALLRAAAEVAEAPVRVSVHRIVGIPLYDGDLEDAEGIPGPVAALKDAIAEADGVILATPEYNHGVPGPLKNAIDWCSRPPGDIGRVFGDKPVAICGATIGGAGTILSQAAWLPVLRQLGMRVWPGKRLMVSSAGDAFSESGELTDAKLRERVAAFVAGFAEFCGSG